MSGIRATVQELEDRVKRAQGLIRMLREENRRLALDLDRARKEAGSGAVPRAGAAVGVLLRQRSTVRRSVDRMLRLLDQMEH